jgi:hypothetical protein
VTYYEICMGDRTVEQVEGADAYQQEGQMTTFFATRRGVVDSWATRVASYRTAEIVSVRRRDERRDQTGGPNLSSHMGSNTSGSATTTISGARSSAKASRRASHCEP